MDFLGEWSIKIILEQGYKSELDRKISLTTEEKTEAPSHLERCFWLKLLCENEYKIHSKAKPKGLGNFIKKPSGVLCKRCDQIIDTENGFGYFHFVEAIVEAINGGSFFDIAKRYKLNTQEGKAFDKLYLVLEKNNWLGIINTKKQTYKPLQNQGLNKFFRWDYVDWKN